MKRVSDQLPFDYFCNAKLPTTDPKVFLFHYLKFIYSNLLVTVFVIFFNFPSLFLRPFTLISLLIMWITSAVFLVANVLLQVLRWFGFDRFLFGLSQRYGGGLSPVNWLQPDIFDLNRPVLSTGLLELSTDFNEHDLQSYQPRIAKALLLISTLMYESECEIMKQIHALTDIPDLLSEPVYFTENSYASVARIFYSKSAGFMIVAFKGTNPFDLSEWLMDATVERIDARAYIFGSVHRGFYDRLFGKSSQVAEVIRHRIEKICRAVQFKNGQVPLWITGHSLGAGLATLFYARMIVAPMECVLLRPCYNFGSPRCGNFDFAQDFKRYENAESSPVKRPLVWRLVNSNDVFPHIPFGSDDTTLAEIFHNDLSYPGFLDYIHVGKVALVNYSGKTFYDLTPCISDMLNDASDMRDFLFQLKRAFLVKYEHFNDFLYCTRLNLRLMGLCVTTRISGQAMFQMLLTNILPFFIYDHLPLNYLRNMPDSAIPDSSVVLLSQ